MEKLYAIGLFLLCAIPLVMGEDASKAPPRFTEISLMWRDSNTCFKVNDSPLDMAQLKAMLHRLKEVVPDQTVHLYVDDRIPARDLMQVLMLLDRDEKGKVMLVPQQKLGKPETPILNLKMERLSLSELDPAVIIVHTNDLLLETFAQEFRSTTKRDYSRQQLIAAWNDPAASLRQKYLAAVCLVEYKNNPADIQQILGDPARSIVATRITESWDVRTSEPINQFSYTFPDGIIEFAFRLETGIKKSWSLSEVRFDDSSINHKQQRNNKPNQAPEDTARKLADPQR